MIATQQVLDNLKQIGLNLYERRLWTALLSRGTSTAGELSTLAKVPHSRTYDVLESLAEKGFVMIQTTKPLKYVAIAPRESLDRAKKKLRDKLDVTVGRIKDLQKSSTMRELDRLYKNGVALIEPGELTGSLRGRKALHQQMETIFKGAKKRISIMTTAKGLNTIHAKHGDFLRKASAKGIKVRIAAPVTRDNSKAVSGLKKFAEVRKADKPMGRLCLVDNNHIVMSLTDDKTVHETQDLGLWTQSNHVAGSVMGPLFDAMWSGMKKA